MYEIGRAGAIERFETSGLRSGNADGELLEAVHGHDVVRTFHDPRCLLSQCNGSERTDMAFVARALHGEIAVEPSVGRALDVGGCRFHVVLRIEMRASRTGTADGMHRSKEAAIVQRLERRERRMQSEESIQVDRRVARDRACDTRGTRNGNGGPEGVVGLVSVRHDHVECVRRTALKEADQRLAFRSPQKLGAERGATEKARAQAKCYNGQCAGFYECSAFHVCLYRRWNSGDPS